MIMITLGLFVNFMWLIFYIINGRSPLIEKTTSIKHCYGIMGDHFALARPKTKTILE